MSDRLISYIRKLGFSNGFKLYRATKKGKQGALSLSFLKHPVFFRGIVSDRYMFEQIFLDNQYNFPIKHTPATIIDLGANVGFGSIYFANKFPDARIFALEPELRNFEQAKKNTAAYPNITVEHGAIWHQPEQISVIDSGHGEAAFMIRSGEGDQTVRAWTVKEIMDHLGISSIDLLKIDIEGTEKEIFEQHYEAWVPYTKLMVVETHDRYKAGTSRAVFQTIGKYNFSLELSGENLILYNNDYEGVF